MDNDQPWEHVDVPFSSTLHDVVRYENRVYTVGDSGTLLERAAGTWSTLLDSGPTGNSNVLKSVATTAGGKRVWFAGSSGSLGYFDVEAGDVVDFSAPEGQSDQWNDVLVDGEAGSEVVRVADNNGEVVTLRLAGSELESTNLVKPRSAGQSIGGLAVGDGQLYAVNTSGKLFASSDGQTWSATDLVDTDLVDVAVSGGTVYALTASGFGYTHDPASGETQKFDTGISATHTVTAGHSVVVAGTNGTIADLVDGTWERVETPASTDLYGVALGKSDLAVGSSGTAIERTRPQ
ncbi:hypothetical protein [Halospeciosus flavus]|uniref:DUF6242 domain-containing protein n=1 Tax=Halospeciosus flavus TaxID=3032283 RepID=A0ABD5Z0W2_9EURY|nr:hypothetical protein [Halospeciosus flavus]